MRRAVAIQMIINRELGLNFNENPWQGSFVIDTLTDLVEEAVYKEFEAISERGGVLGAVDTMYQRGKIQEESLYYEARKHDGSLPLIGVNTFLPREHAGDIVTETELIGSADAEKKQQITNVQACRQSRNLIPAKAGEREGEREREGEGERKRTSHAEPVRPEVSKDERVPQGARTPGILTHLQHTARERANVFAALTVAVKYNSLGQISHALYEVGWEYRRNM